MRPIGKKRWAIPGGFIPLHGTGKEPTFTSHDKLCLLNTGDEMANVEVVLHYTERDQVGPYRLTVAPRRVRHVRVNDLIFPHAPPLETPYAAVVVCDVPIVVQFTRQDTRQRELAWVGPMAYAEDD